MSVNPPAVPVQEPIQGASEPKNSEATLSDITSSIVLVPSSQPGEQEQPKMDIDENQPKPTEETPKNAEVESVLQRITPETLEALKQRDLEITELRSKIERLTGLIEDMISSCESCGHEVLLADNELIVSLEREVELRNRLASNSDGYIA